MCRERKGAGGGGGGGGGQRQADSETGRQMYRSTDRQTDRPIKNCRERERGWGKEGAGTETDRQTQELETDRYNRSLLKIVE